jgi:2-keto-4-pentenoate hydratase
MRHKRLFIFVMLIGGLIMTVCPVSGGSYDAITEKIQAAYMTKKPYPLVSQEITGLTVDQAYEIQSELTRLREEKGEVLMGYKAGATSTPAQKAFGLNAPIWGTLCKSMLRWPGTLYHKGFAHMFIELEIGFRFGKDIMHPVQDSASLKRSVAIVFPAIELPDVAYENMKLIKGTDLIATNVAARKVLIGKAVPVGKMDLNTVKVTLFHNGQEVTGGMGKDALGDQWEALKWVVNDVLARGGHVKDGYIVITGSLGKMVPAKFGTYTADFGDFGSMEFECR